MAEIGPVDILVNNAGMQHVSPVEEFAPEKWDQVIGLNLNAVFHTTRLAVPHMKAKGWGRIINTASAHSKQASPFKSAYIATKHAIVGATKAMALEFASKGIRANVVAPGAIATDMLQTAYEAIAAANNISVAEAAAMENASIPTGRPAEPGGRSTEYTGHRNPESGCGWHVCRGRSSVHPYR